MCYAICRLAGTLTIVGYTLTEIKEESTPLAMLPNGDAGYLGAVILVMALLITLCAVFFYLVGCVKCRKRIRQLHGANTIDPGWKLGRLRRMVSEIEMEETERLVTGMEEMFKKNIKKFEPFCE